MEEKKLMQILADALEYMPIKVSKIMDMLDSCIAKTSDEQMIKPLNDIWMELDELKIELVNCAKFFKFLQGEKKQ
jgi:hypothetical protein